MVEGLDVAWGVSSLLVRRLMVVKEGVRGQKLNVDGHKRSLCSIGMC